MGEYSMKTPKLAPISLGRIVRHLSVYGMKEQDGLVVEDAGMKYGRHYVWVSWIDPATKTVTKTAFWDDVLVLSPQSTSDFLAKAAKSMSYATL
jgi:hypothetical protein